MKKLSFPKHIYVIFSFGILILYLWTLTSNPIASSPSKTAFFTLDGNWTQIIGDTSIDINSIQNAKFSDDMNMDTLIFECTLPKMDEDYIILYYTRYLENAGYVNTQCIHTFHTLQEFSVLDTPGSAWNLIELTPEMSEQTLRLEYSTRFYDSEKKLYDIYILKETSVETVRIGLIGIYVIAIIFLLCVTLFSFFYAVIWNNRRNQHFVLITHLYLYYTLWLLSELNAFDLIFGRPILSYLLSMAFIRIIPFTLYRVIVKDHTDYPLLQFVIGILNLANIFIPWFLQFTLGISLIDTLLINQLVFLSNIILYLLIICKGFPRRFHKGNSEAPFVFLGAIFLGIILDYLFPSKYNMQIVTFNTFSTFAFFIYSIVVFVSFTHKNSTTVVEKHELEQSYRKLETRSLMEQIKSHFIFNTLNTISALCKHDAAKADYATKLFAKYLRSYMYLINQVEPIPFETEIKLVKEYLEIEQIRFGDSITFYIDVAFEEFNIPPLTLQPIVENSVVHGIRHADKGIGSIHITSTRHDHYVEIIIQDDGAGFDSSTNSPWDSIGLSNIRKRLEVMSNGTITIDSIVNHGTTVKITIPLS